MSHSITLTKETKQALIRQIQHHYEATHDLEVGELAASFTLDFILEEIAPIIYNQAIDDAHAYAIEKLDDLFELQKRTR
ncbi:DUF2164 domain-containing protein [Paraliobacillus salinarum]|uniref:DUF2164 domain-containing protein n=1 Tax=Paraliobacillus salinarum TaxID=1158996 RepID=UPI0015F6D2D9|nr:DUF2164 domain-containing protein [Paraliobacillus salinarum]